MSRDYCHFNDGNHNSFFNITIFGDDLRLCQNPASHNLGHGAVVWDASVVFSKYMECNAKDFEPSKLGGKTVLELGSGCGLAGIAFMLRGALVTCTDMEKVTTNLTERNVLNIYTQIKLERESNGETVSNSILLRPSVVSVDWTHPDRNPNLLEVYDYVLLTDCVFSMELVDDLVRTILHYSGPKTTIICCHEIRDEVFTTPLCFLLCMQSIVGLVFFLFS
jgi:protein N-lysine methyltransferase METTL21D